MINQMTNILGKRRRGMTLVEVAIASALSVVVGLGMVSLTIMSQRILKSTVSQQMDTKWSKSVVMQVTRALRPAVASTIKVTTSAGALAAPGTLTGVKIEFGWPGEPVAKRKIELVCGATTDGNLNYLTGWDNYLLIDSDTASASASTEMKIPWVSSANWNGAFSYKDATTPVTLRLRIGDPSTVANPANTLAVTNPAGLSNSQALLTDGTKLGLASDARTGAGLQGVDINITVAPRN